jgi:hypothetical protein
VKLWVAAFSLSTLVALSGCDSKRNGDTAAAGSAGQAPSAGGSSGGSDVTTGGGSNAAGEGGSSGSSSAGQGSTESGGSGGQGAAPDCAALAGDVCAALEMCASYPFRAQYGDLATCAATFEAGCTAALLLGALDEPACRRALSASGCQGFPGGELPPACIRPSGVGELNAPCGSRSECASSFCVRKGECGVCTAPASADSACATTEDCEGGLVCSQGTCKPALGAGAECDGQVCGLHGWCVGGVCAALGQDGATCTTETPCDSTAGFVCAAGVCEAVSYVAEGEICGVTSTQPRCSGGLACVAEVAFGERRCIVQPDLGEPCPDGRCKAPFLCNSGTCGVLEPAFCN